MQPNGKKKKKEEKKPMKKTWSTSCVYPQMYPFHSFKNKHFWNHKQKPLH